MPNFRSRARLHGTTLRLMLSDKAAARFGRRMEALLCDMPHEIARLEALASANGDSGVHIGFIAREVIADSGSGTSVPLARFAAVAGRSSSLSWVRTCAAGPDRPIVASNLCAERWLRHHDPYAEIDSVLPKADWLILAGPLTDLTRRLIDARRLSLMPRGSHVVNVGRGSVVVDRDLIEALQLGQIASAFLDVFEVEPLPPESPFWTLPNIMMTPHSASHSSAAYDNVREIFLDSLARWRDGLPRRNDLTARTTAAPGA